MKPNVLKFMSVMYADDKEEQDPAVKYPLPVDEYSVDVVPSMEE